MIRSDTQGAEEHASHKGGLLAALPLSPESRLVLACARVTASARDHARIREALCRPLRWGDVVSIAEHHRLAGMLHHHLSTPELSALVPGDTLARLQAMRDGYAAHELFFQAELRVILALLQSDGIPVIVLKGAALQGTVYPVAGLRPMSDLDILVPDARAHDAQTRVTALGYRPGGSPEIHEAMERTGRHLPALIGEGKPTIVEIHRHVVNADSPMRFDVNEFWEEAGSAVFSGVRAGTLRPEHQLIHLCINFLLDRNFKSTAALGQLTDVAELVRQQGASLDWRRLSEDVRRLGVGGPVGCALSLASELLDSPVPEGVPDSVLPVPLDAGDVARFARDRVLPVEDRFVIRNLAGSGGKCGPVQLTASVLHRLVPSRATMVSKYGDAARGWPGLRMYFRRLWEGLALVPRVILHPRSLWRDVTVDRWIHSLCVPDAGARGTR